MDQETKDGLAVNASNAAKMWSNWIMTAAGTMFAIYLALPIDQQQTLIAHLPVPPWVIPIFTSVVGVVARLWPQKNLNSESKP